MDDDAFAAFVREHATLLTRVAHVVFGDVGRAQDAAQTALEKLSLRRASVQDSPAHARRRTPDQPRVANRKALRPRRLSWKSSPMGYLVETTGSLVLPAQDEPAAASAARAAMLACDGWLEVDGPHDLPGLASYAAAALSRSGDVMTVTPDEDADAKWSEQASAFWSALAPFVREGHVEVEGEDEERWSYVFADGRLTQVGRNGWDGSGEDLEPVGDVAAARPADRQRRGQRYLVFGSLAAAGGFLLVLLGQPVGLVPLGIGLVDLAVAARLRSGPAR